MDKGLEKLTLVAAVDGLVGTGVDMGTAVHMLGSYLGRGHSSCDQAEARGKGDERPHKSSGEPWWWVGVAGGWGMGMPGGWGRGVTEGWDD